jgi:futalosine hydrolase
LIGGLGIHSTTYSLSKIISENDFSMIINVGIGGTYNTKHKIGEVFLIESEQFGDLGTYSNGNFISLKQMSLSDKNILKNPFLNNHIFTENLALQSFPHASGLSVNLVSDLPEIIGYRKDLAEIESMEGVAVFDVCINENIPFAEIRSISNYAGDLNKQNWDIPLAIKNLNNSMKKILLDFIS